MTDDRIDAVAVRVAEERREKFRAAAQRLVDDHKQRRKVDPHALQWARGILSRFNPTETK